MMKFVALMENATVSYKLDIRLGPFFFFKKTLFTYLDDLTSCACFFVWFGPYTCYAGQREINMLCCTVLY